MKQRRTKSFGTHVHNTSNNTSTKLQLQRIKLHIEIVNLKPVTPTTILLPADMRDAEQNLPYLRLGYEHWNDWNYLKEHA